MEGTTYQTSMTHKQYSQRGSKASLWQYNGCGTVNCHYGDAGPLIQALMPLMDL